ncbi:hypothetical protein B0G62_106186 [Paraburkholderia eburnea]|uniref:Anti-sigma factor n=1 Tax=Paraburkholderia eburnea TaxID=1189126 RepID=A0A2S4MA94_9BURK|nr:hypothetical protein [Paraburkholderia eburnea]POR51652.1 hypothetical protein B0G62_106186 [Paraburkholderia eburnea]PRZ22683.1 hypothetical protein BX588_106186 [Paraburkholderia eburnea]
MSEPSSEAPTELALAWLRGELSAAERQAFVERLAHDAALRDELDWLQALADAQQQHYVDETSERAFAALQDALGPLPASKPASTSTSWLARAARWLREHANVLQPALIALVLVQTGVIGLISTHDNPQDSSSAPASAFRGAAPSCLTVWVDLRDTARMADLRRWMTLYGASFAGGPDASGRVNIAFADMASLKAALNDSLLQQIATRTDAPPGCAAQ